MLILFMIHMKWYRAAYRVEFSYLGISSSNNVLQKLRSNMEKLDEMYSSINNNNRVLSKL